MTDTWTQRWDDRFRNDEFVYGESPNEFLKEHLTGLKPGDILFPAEGEGRNAIYAATLGWKTSAFDISIEGQRKAGILAGRNHVHIDYKVGDLKELKYSPSSFDAIALIFAHFPADIKSGTHKELKTLLRPGGIVLFEAFSKSHLEYLALNPAVGGPKDIESLFSMEEIKNDFSDFNILLLEEKVIELSEGEFHKGKGSVIRFIGRKKD